MKKREIFRGVATALITPFKDETIDYAALEGLIERQIKAGVDALVIGGTTAEAATLSDVERYELFRKSRDIISQRSGDIISLFLAIKPIFNDGLLVFISPNDSTFS